MPFWCNIYFMNANTPLMEQMLMFHDHSMIIIYSIMMLLLLMMVYLTKNSTIYYNLMENQNMELAWTLMPMVLLMFIAVPSIRLLYLMEELFQPCITMKTIGHQWYWSYEYSDFKINFDSFINQSDHLSLFRLMDTDTSMMMPTNTPTRLLVTSADVIHSWTIQSLGVKTDAIPGRLNLLNFTPLRPGMFFGQCSEICGSNHSFMPIKLNVTDIKTFKNMILEKNK